MMDATTNIRLQIDEDSTRRYLTSHHWPESLQDVLVKGCATFALRYFIIDDSGLACFSSSYRHRIHG